MAEKIPEKTPDPEPLQEDAPTEPLTDAEIKAWRESMRSTPDKRRLQKEKQSLADNAFRSEFGNVLD